MAIEVSCPHCNKPADPQARYCERCGVDLALAAVVAERDVVEPILVPAGYPIAPEILAPRIGDTMINMGILDRDELQAALEFQQQRAAESRPLLLGQAMLELGLVERKTLDQVITVQILQLQTALRDANRQLERRVQQRTLELQKALERLAELNQLKSNFIANISHELRTPLTHLKGYLDLLLTGHLGPLTGKQAEALEVLLRSEARLETLIEDLIHFSFASQGNLPLEITQTDISELIRICIDHSKQKASAANVVLEASLADDLPFVRADVDKIGWVLIQLIDNAVKFSNRGGRVEVGAKQSDGLVKITVCDTGIGFSEERIGEIFEPFHQLDGSATRRYGGTGLGLALVRQIVEAHGSTVDVQSSNGKGSCFGFSLPVDQNS